MVTLNCREMAGDVPPTKLYTYIENKLSQGDIGYPLVCRVEREREKNPRSEP